MEAPGIDPEWTESSELDGVHGGQMTKQREDAFASEHGGGAGNRTRVRKASHRPSFTCVVVLTLTTGLVNSVNHLASEFSRLAMTETTLPAQP